MHYDRDGHGDDDSDDYNGDDKDDFGETMYDVDRQSECAQLVGTHCCQICTSSARSTSSSSSPLS